MPEIKTVNGLIRFRRDTTDNWKTNKQYVPASGEPCFDIDLNKIKIGDGKTTYENLPYINNISDDEIKEMQSDISNVSSLVGTQSVQQQISEAINAIDIDSISKIDSISVGGTLLDIINKKVDIPIGTQTTVGVVMGSDEIAIQNDGTMNVNKININKISQDESDILILNNGNSYQVY